MEDLDVYLGRAKTSLREKMLHSIELLRKAEKIAKVYDPENGYYLAFSGGKDSQALYHIAQLSGVQFKAHFSPTSVDPPQVIRFIRKNYPDVQFEKLKMSIYQDAINKGILPSQKIRWCCADFKEGAGAGKVTLIGIRKAESARRSKRNEVEMSSKKFSGNYEQFEQWRDEKLAKKNKRKKKKAETPSLANLKAISQETISGCITGKDSLLVSPIIYWTESDVWEFLNDVVRVPHCELYDKGYTRIGCIMCPMSSYKQKIKEMQHFPHVKEKWLQTIMTIRRGGNLTKRVYTARKMEQDLYPTSGRILATGTTDRNSMPRTNGSSGGGYIQSQDPNHWIGETKAFSDGSSSDCVNDEQKEREIAENILDWWISGVSYKKWYSMKFQQLKIDFKE